MKLSALKTAVLLTATLAVSPSFSQTAIKTDLNIQLKQALCTQNWVQAIQVIDQMKTAAPQQAAELTIYRGQIQTFLKTGAVVPNWPTDCSTNRVINQTPANSNTQIPGKTPAPANTRTSTPPTGVQNTRQGQ